MPPKRTAEQEVLFGRGVINLKSGNYTRAFEMFDKALGSTPTGSEPDIETLYMRAASLIQLKRIAEANHDLDRADATIEHIGDPTRREEERRRWQLVHNALRASILLLQDRLADARTIFEGIENQARVNGVDQTSPIVPISRDLAAALAPYEGSLRLGYGYDSNVSRTQRNFLNDDFHNNNPPPLAPDLPRPDRHGRNADSFVFTELDAVLRAAQSTAFEIGVHTTAYGESHFSLSSFDIDSLDLGPYLSWRLRDDLYVGLSTSYNVVQRGGDPFVNRFITTPWITVLEGTAAFTTVYYQYEKRDFRLPRNHFQDNGTGPLIFNGTLEPDGENYAVGILQGITLRNDGSRSSQLLFDYRYENQYRNPVPDESRDNGPRHPPSGPREHHVEIAAYRGFLHRGGVSLYVPIGSRFAVDFREELRYEQYPLNRQRNQEYVFASETLVGFTYDLTQDLSVRLFYAFEADDSFRKALQFDRQVGGVELIWWF